MFQFVVSNKLELKFVVLNPWVILSVRWLEDWIVAKFWLVEKFDLDDWGQIIDWFESEFGTIEVDSGDHMTKCAALNQIRNAIIERYVLISRGKWCCNWGYLESFNWYRFGYDSVTVLLAIGTWEVSTGLLAYCRMTYIKALKPKTTTHYTHCEINVFSFHFYVKKYYD